MSGEERPGAPWEPTLLQLALLALAIVPPEDGDFEDSPDGLDAALVRDLESGPYAMQMLIAENPNVRTALTRAFDAARRAGDESIETLQE